VLTTTLLLTIIKLLKAASLLRLQRVPLMRRWEVAASRPLWSVEELDAMTEPQNPLIHVSGGA
jgi:hypothetical protein